MGILASQVPHHDIAGLLDLFDVLGIDADAIRKFRVASPFTKREVARLMRDGEGRVVHVFDTWTRVTLGGSLQNGKDFLEALRAEGCSVTELASQMFIRSSFVPAMKESEIELVHVTPQELGFVDHVTRKDMEIRAFELGLVACPMETAALLCIQHLEVLRQLFAQFPRGVPLCMSMESIGSGGIHRRIFAIEFLGRDLMLSTASGRLALAWSADSHWVFMRRKNF